jgi:hypothetical protein
MSYRIKSFTNKCYVVPWCVFEPGHDGCHIGPNIPIHTDGPWDIKRNHVANHIPDEIISIYHWAKLPQFEILDAMVNRNITAEQCAHIMIEKSRIAKRDIWPTGFKWIFDLHWKYR